LYQGASGDFLSPGEDIALPGEAAARADTLLMRAPLLQRLLYGTLRERGHDFVAGIYGMQPIRREILTQ